MTRIGINEKEGNFPARLNSHYRPWGSIFFRHLHAALANRYRNEHRRSWERLRGDTREQRVLSYLNVNCSFTVIAVDSSDEAVEWEKKLISTLAPYSYQFASPNWLGNWAENEKIRTFGLWNAEYVKRFDYEFSQGDLTQFRKLVQRERRRIEKLILFA